MKAFFPPCHGHSLVLIFFFLLVFSPLLSFV
jgi:hypothetical protein